MLGLETAFALALQLGLPVERVLALLSWNPARIAGLTSEHGGPVVEGRPANLTVLDLDASWTVEPERLASRSRNTPYRGWSLQGRARHTVLRGEPVVVNGEATR
jgi:dihydroorotase